MKVIYPKPLPSFTCLASACPDTCCAGWEIVIDASHQHDYQNLSGEIGRRLKAAMIRDADGDIIFKNCNQRCPFLNSTLLCDLYTELGEAALSDTCRIYPRWTFDYGLFEHAGLSFSCPEVIRLFMENPEPVELLETDDDRPVLPCDGDTAMLLKLQSLLRQNLSVLYSDFPSLSESLCAVLQLTVFCAPLLFKDTAESFQTHLAQFETVPVQPASSDMFYHTISTLVTLLSGCEHRNPAFTQTLQQLLADPPAPDDCLTFRQVHGDCLYFFRHLMAYYLHHYFLESVFSYEPLYEVQRSVLLCVAVYLLCVRKWKTVCQKLPSSVMYQIFWTFSREIEHSIPNMTALEEPILTTACFTPNALCRFLQLL